MIPELCFGSVKAFILFPHFQRIYQKFVKLKYIMIQLSTYLLEDDSN